MMMKKPLALVLVLVLALLGLIACASSQKQGFLEEKPAGGEERAQGPAGTFDPGQGPCIGLECKRAACTGGATTTISGKVYDPAGANPLYNAIVYIPSGENPNGPLPKLKDSGQNGVACEPCAGIVLNPLASTLTDTDGHFELKDVPVDKKVPVVIQIGKWRRKFNIDVSKGCADNAVPDRTLTLPRNGGEGDMPQIAVTTGGADALECLLHGIGVDDSEFVPGAGGSGHIHVFNGIDGRYTDAPEAGPLWNDAAALKKYDLALLSCEGGEHLENKGDTTPSARSGMVDYLDAGGRVFATHFHYVWFKDSPSKELRELASFADNLPAPTKGIHDVDMSFAKGAAFGNWLKAVEASSTVGKIDLTDVLDTVSTVHAPAIPWIKSAGGKPRYFSVNTPIGKSPDSQCGRAVYSDLHITNTAGPKTAEACKIASGALSPQQKALEFFLFDLSACISDDRVPPTPPK